MEIPITLNLPDQEPVSPLDQALIDVTVAQSGVRLRPGGTEITDTTEGVQVDGLYNWEEQGYVVVVAGGSVYKVASTISGFDDFLLESGDTLLLEDGSGTLLLEADDTITDVTNDTMATGTRVIFANFGDYLYLANGGTIKELHPSQAQVTHGGNDYTCILNNIDVEPGVTSGWATYWQDDGAGSSYTAWASGTRYGSGNADSLEDADAPTSVKWIAAVDSYLLALSINTQRLFFSVVDEPWSWDSDWVSATFLPDDANCLQIFDGDIWVGGRRSIQSFVNDNNTPFVPSAYSGIVAGVLSPYTFMPVKGTLVWIDEKKRLVQLNGRTVSSINKSLDTFLNDINQISDAVADLYVVDGIEYYTIHFPSENKTISLNLDNMGWSQWEYNPTGLNKRWNINAITEVPLWGMVLGGDRDGKIQQIKASLEDDDGTTIEGRIRTPRMQTPRTIRVSDLMVALTKIAQTTSDQTASLAVRWRDDGGDWGSWRTQSFSDNETDHVLHVRRCGAYRYNRQYEFDISEVWPYGIQKVEQV